MYSRWREDAINLKSTIINILIGINDAAKWADKKCGSSPEQYDLILRLLIQKVLKEYADKLGERSKILWDGVHPTVLGHSIISEQWLKITEL